MRKSTVLIIPRKLKIIKFSIGTSKIFVTVLILGIGQIYLHSTPLECEKFPLFSIDMLLRWSKEVSLEINVSLIINIQVAS